MFSIKKYIPISLTYIVIVLSVFATQVTALKMPSYRTMQYFALTMIYIYILFNIKYIEISKHIVVTDTIVPSKGILLITPTIKYHVFFIVFI